MANKPNDNEIDFKSEILPDLDEILHHQPAGAESLGVQAARKALLAAARANRTPLDIMQYFARLSDRNADRENHNAGCKTRRNPFMVQFFCTTNYEKQVRDTTAWCNTSLNWSRKLGGRLHGTISAASASFQDAPCKTHAPKPGDLVVFRDRDDLERGHVNLSRNQDDNPVQVFGSALPKNGTEIWGTATAGVL